MKQGELKGPRSKLDRHGISILNFRVKIRDVLMALKDGLAVLVDNFFVVSSNSF